VDFEALMPKDAKLEMFSERARIAYAEMDKIFVARMNTGVTPDGSFPIRHVAKYIEAIEAQGWIMENASWVNGRRRSFNALVIFRRG
jgi:hypothetical protein